MSWEEHRIYPELDLERNSSYNLGRLQREQQARKAWLGAHLDCIIPIRFSVGGIDKGTTECRGSMSNQPTVFSRGAFVIVCKGWHLRETMQWQSREILQSFHNTNLYFTWAAYNFYFLIIYNLQFWLSPLEPLACNQELVPHHYFVCSSVQFPFAPFQQVRQDMYLQIDNYFSHLVLCC